MDGGGRAGQGRGKVMYLLLGFLSSYAVVWIVASLLFVFGR